MSKSLSKSTCIALGGALVAVVGTAIVLVMFLGGGNAVPPLDAPPEAANKPVKGSLLLTAKEAPQVPEVLTVYRLEQIAKNRKEIEELAKEFDLVQPIKLDELGAGSRSSGVEHEEFDNYYAREGDPNIGRIFHYYFRTGNYEFWIGSKYGEENPDLPTVEEAGALAMHALEERGLLPDEAFVSTIGGPQAETIIDDQYRKFLLQRDVEISREVDGRTIVGPGMRIMVSLGTDGELIGVDSTMRNLVPYKKFEVKSLEEAIEDAEKGNDTMNLHPDVENPEVSRVELIYYADPSKTTNQFLQPVYCLSGPETCIYVPAIKQ
ncbi:MAG: hypothetical protein KKF41_04155 [Actinobacteria bacterium]|nr:hypothetical protein [Actinomycetota bacterium]MBU1943403.1 hypothetical protein [Actinomycetota bacterium]MBU2686760.1 hypothetical protein [Actinomycetota bacterium]